MEERMGKKKDNNKSAKDENETAATAATNTKEVKTGETKVVQTFCKEIQAPKNVHYFVTKLPADNQGLRSTEDVQVGEKSSHIQSSFMTDEEAEELFKRIEKTVTLFTSYARRVSSAQYQDSTNSILDAYPGFSQLLKICYREFFKNAVRLVCLNDKNIDRLWNIFYSSCEVSETVKKSKKFHVMKVIKAVNETKIPTKAEIFNTYFRKKDSSSVDDTQKPTYLPQQLTKQKECKKEGDGFSGDIQEKPQCPHKTESEWNDETQLKNPDGIKGKAKYGEEMKHKNVKGNLCAGHTKPSEISKRGILRNLDKYTDLMRFGSDTDLEMHQKFQPPLNIKGTQDTYFEEKGIKTDAEALEDIKVSKEEADEINDLIMEWKQIGVNKKQNNAKSLEDKEALKKVDEIEDLIMKLKKCVEYRKEKECGSSTDNKEAAGKFPITTTEDKKEKEKGKENVGRSNEGIQDSRLNKGIISQKQESTRKNYMDETICPETTKILPAGDFNPHIEGIMSQQKSSSVVKRNFFSLGTEPITADAKTESHDKTKDTTDIKYDVLQEVQKILPAGDFNPHIERIMSQQKSSSVGKRSFFSLGTEPITADAKTESHDQTKETTDIKYDVLQEVVVPAAWYEPEEVVIDLKQTEDIHFHFATDNSMNILVGDKDYQLKGNQDITFSCKEENVTISFTGKQISVSTPSSEFDISIRKSDPVDLTDKATETDDMM